MGSRLVRRISRVAAGSAASAGVTVECWPEEMGCWKASWHGGFVLSSGREIGRGRRWWKERCDQVCK